MARYRYYTADVFTDTPFGANQLAVFPDARNIPDRRLQHVALKLDDFLPDPWIPQGYSCGLPFLFVPVRNRAAVARAQLRLDAWERTLKGTWASEIHLFARDAERPGSDLRARVFVPGLSVPEDPATGSANAALAGYLAARDTRRDGTLRWRVEQGFEMGRPSILDVEADLRDGMVTAVRVGGSSVLVCDGTMEIA